MLNKASSAGWDAIALLGACLGLSFVSSPAHAQAGLASTSDGRGSITSSTSNLVAADLASQTSRVDVPLGAEGLCTPGLTVARAVFDRHAPQDVGGRLDVTKAWRPTIPDPVNGNTHYRNLTGDKPSSSPATASNSENVEPCFDHLPELATNASDDGSRKLSFGKSSMGASSFSRPLWWASSSLALSSLPAGTSIITSGFGMRYHPILRTVRAHAGVDLAAPIGTPVLATQNGVVRVASNVGGYGLLVNLDHGGGLETRYGHLSKLRVVPGQRVRKGEVVGYVGSTGRSTGPHLHYEVRSGGQAVNPLHLRRRN